MEPLDSHNLHQITEVSYLMYLTELDETSAILVRALYTSANIYANHNKADEALLFYEKIYAIAPVGLRIILRNRLVRERIYRKLVPSENLTGEIARARKEVITLADKLYLGSGALRCVSRGLNIIQEEQPQELARYESQTICKSLLLICSHLAEEIIAPIDISRARHQTKHQAHWRPFADFFGVDHNINTAHPVFGKDQIFFAGENCKLLLHNNPND